MNFSCKHEETAEGETKNERSGKVTFIKNSSFTLPQRIKYRQSLIPNMINIYTKFFQERRFVIKFTLFLQGKMMKNNGSMTMV